MYELDDPVSQMTALGKALTPSGRLSVLTKNYGAAIEQVLPEDETRLIETGEYINHLGITAKAYTLHELQTLVEQTGLGIEGEYGVRALYNNDKRPLQKVSRTKQGILLLDEISASHDPKFYDTAQLLHIVAARIR